MDIVTVLIAVVAIGFGFTSLVLRFAEPSAFAKLEPMKSKFGNAAGSAIHFGSYVAIPLAFGIWTLLAGLNGDSFFE